MTLINNVRKFGQYELALTRFLSMNNRIFDRRLSKCAPCRSPVNLVYTSYGSSTEELPQSSPDVTSRYPVMIMHGLFGSKTNWNSLAKSINQKTKRKVIAVDARNHGESPHSPHMTYHHMAKDIVHLMEKLNFGKAILIGHSMGGSAMMYVALNYPELVEKLVVVDMSPIRTSDSLSQMSKIFDAMLSIQIKTGASLSETRKDIDRQLSKYIREQTLRQFLLMNLVEHEPGKFKWRVNLPILAQNFGNQIAVFPNSETKVFNGQTLFLGGSESDYIKKEDHAKIRGLFPNAEIRYIMGAGHWVQSEKPAEFLDLVDDPVLEAAMATFHSDYPATLFY